MSASCWRVAVRGAGEGVGLIFAALLAGAAGGCQGAAPVAPDGDHGAHEEGGGHGEHDGDGHGDDRHDGDGHGGDGHGGHSADSESGMLVISDDLRRDLRISLVQIGAKEGIDHLEVLGEIRLHEDAEARVAAPIGARVVRVMQATGARVRAGEPLVELESVEVGRARAELLAARARAARARAALERKRALGEVISAAEREDAEAEDKVATAEVAAAEAALRALGVGAWMPDPVDGRFTLRAPAAGTVLARSVVAGAVVDPEEILFRIGDMDRLQVEVYAFERDAARLRPGAAAEVTLSALPGRRIRATVARVGQEVDPASRTIPVRLDLAEPVEGLRPGMAAAAATDVPASAGAVLSVPAAALQRLGGDWVVFLPVDGGRFRVQPVGRGRDLGAEVEILSGLQAGASVVLDGAFLLKAEAERLKGGGGHHDH